MKRLIAAITIGAVLAAAAAVLGVLYAREHSRADRAPEDERGLAAQLQRAQQKDANAYLQGLLAAEKNSKKFHTTYADGFKNGWRGVFAGFDGWTDGSWYLVQVAPSPHGHEFKNPGVDVQPCEQVTVSNDQVYSRPNACP